MSETETTKSPTSHDVPQALVGFMTNDEWDGLLGHVNALVLEMDDLPFPHVKEKVFELLAGVDAIHREALRRLVRLFKEGVLEAVVTDPAIHTLMELYDLLPPEANKTEDSSAKVKFSQGPVKFVPPKSKTRPDKPKYPHWMPVPKHQDELIGGSITECMVEERRILICRAGDKFFALDSACFQDGSSLADAQLNKFTLTCPHHDGCYYDIRTGKRIASNGAIECFSVKADAGGRILVGVDMEFKPQLPAF